MSTLSFTIETEDHAVVSATAKMLLNLVGEAADAPVPEHPTVEPEPTVLAPVAKTYDVDGRMYTAEQVIAGGWSPTDLLAKGWSVARVAEVLNIPIDDVVAEDGTGEEDGSWAEGFDDRKGPELDSRDMPWDARIHAGTKTKISDGSWKKKKGVDKDVVEQVEAELINLMSIPSATTEPEPVVIPPPAAAEPEPEPVVIAPPVAEADGMSFAKFLKACADKMTAGETSMERVLEVVNAKGIANLRLVGKVPEHIPELWAEISTHQKVAK